jgi:hypothetical protein
LNIICDVFNVKIVLGEKVEGSGLMWVHPRLIRGSPGPSSNSIIGHVCDNTLLVNSTVVLTIQRYI